MSPTRAEVNKEAVKWAREAAGLDASTAAKKLQVKIERVEDWESGAGLPTVGQLRNMAKVYGRTLAFFFRRSLPDDDLPKPPDYRTLPASERGAMSFELRRELRVIVHRRSALLDLEPEQPAFDVPAIAKANDEDSAALLRQVLEVPVTDQWEAADNYAMLGKWTRALERVGVLVFQTKWLKTREARGLSLSLDPLPIVLLAGGDVPSGKMFTLFHEVFHIVRGTGGLCNDLEGSSLAEERRCNALAAAFLMPQGSFFEDFVSGRGDISALARRYKVSPMAAAIRLVQQRVISNDEVEDVKREMDAAVEERSSDTREIRIPVATMRLRDLGRRYTTAVLDAYHRDDITLTDASQLLGTKVRHFPKIEGALGMGTEAIPSSGASPGRSERR
jgi:Zn-dependent peptidase ImmA (M78 family)